MRGLLRVALVAAALLSACFGAASAASAAPAMWVVKSPHSQIYLFGTCMR